MSKIRLLELFGGIGACSSALDRLGIDYEIVDYVEIDKYAVASYNAIHNTNFEPSDICNYDKDIQVDLIMHGSPCQDFSLAGKQAGGDKDSGTRSSLMYETLRMVEKLKPKYVIWENVKNLLSKKHRHNFDNYLNCMNDLGYTNYYQVLNARDYGIPQNRERVFTISIRNDVDTGFIFPQKEELKLKLKDVLEDEVDEKYFLSDKMINFFIKNEQAQIEKGNGFRFGVSDGNVIAKAVTTRAGGRMDDNFIKIKNATDTQATKGVVVLPGAYGRDYDSKGKMQEVQGVCDTLQAAMGNGGGNIPLVNDDIKVIGNYSPSGHDASRIVDSDGIAPTVKENHGTVTAILEPTNKSQKEITLKSKDKRLRNLVNNTKLEEGKVMNLDLYNQTTNENISQCLTEPNHNSQRLFDGLRIRKLTPKECWRLMGFTDEEFEKAEKVNSNTQLYKQAGNSIVVNVLQKILYNLLGDSK